MGRTRFKLAALAALVTGLLAAYGGQAAAQSDYDGGRIPYLTLRDKTGSDSPVSFYGDERGTLKAGWCGVSRTDLPFMSPIADSAPFRVPDEILRVTSVEEAPVDTVVDSVIESAAGGPALLYVHGYKLDFPRGCTRAFQFSRAMGLEDRFLWFSWPADGVAMNYARDEADVNWSAPDIADAIADLARRHGPGNVDVAGHSLGGRGVVVALFDLASRYPDVQLGEVVLLAPDIDFQLFLKMLPHIRPAVENITIYVASNDRPLALSEQLHGYPRLGQSGNDVGLLEGVTVVDLSRLPIRSVSGHLYHIYNPEVGQDLARLLRDRLPPEDRGLDRAGANLWTLNPFPE